MEEDAKYKVNELRIKGRIEWACIFLACRYRKSCYPTGDIDFECFHAGAIRLPGFAGDMQMTQDDTGRSFAKRPDDARDDPSGRKASTAPAVADDRPTRIMSLSSATRDYARSVEEGRIDRESARNLKTWSLAMGPWIWAWQRALRLAGQPPWRASTVAEERDERTRAADWMLKDIAGWEKALATLDAQTRRARLYDRPVPPPLAIPTPVADAIKAKRQAALERATARRGGGSGGGGSPPALTPDDGVGHPPFPSKPR